MTGEDQRLAAVRQARERLAGRVRVPLWYAGTYTAAMIVVFVLAVVVAPADAATATFIIAVVVFAAADRVLRATAGFDVSLNLVRRFHSLRVATPVFLGVVAAASTAVWLARAGLPTGWAVVVALAGAAACAVARFAPLAGIRADVRTGRGVDAR